MATRPPLRSVPWLAVTVVALATLAATACGSDDADTRSETLGMPSTQQDLEAHEWVLSPRESTPRIVGGRRPTISFSDDAVTGTGPCNTFRAEVSIEYDTIEITDLVSTLMACEPAVMDAERAYFAALQAVDHAEVDDDDDQAVLTGGEVRLTFDEYDVDEGILGAWQVVEVASGQAIRSVLTGTEPTLTFQENGDATLRTGCNDGRTTWTLDGELLTFGPVAQTRKLCPEPPGLMEQEAALVAALESSASAVVTPDALTLLDDHGRIVLGATRNK